MNEQEKKSYLERYKKAKEKGVPFFPDIIFKDAVVSLVVFLVLVALAYFIGAPVEGRANPNDTSYTPRPEWYFLFLFQLLKYFPGNLEGPALQRRRQGFRRDDDPGSRSHPARLI